MGNEDEDGMRMSIGMGLEWNEMGMRMGIG